MEKAGGNLAELIQLQKLITNLIEFPNIKFMLGAEKERMENK